LFQYRSQRIALAVSVVIHILILAAYRPLARIQLFPHRADEASAEAAVPLVFELVETPDDAIQQRPETAYLLSDKNAIARNEIYDEDKPTGEAVSEGVTQYRVFAGRLEPAGAPEAPLQSPQTEQPQDRPRDRSREHPQDAYSDLSALTFDSRQSLHDELYKDPNPLAETGPLSMPRNFMDDMDYDQRASSAEALGGITLNTYAWDFASYILEMKKKLRENTYPPVAFTRFGMISGETVLTFRVWPDGSMTDLAVITYAGHRTLMETSVDAVKNASPFRSLPEDFPEKFLELKWTFIYFVYK
jgi:hypothetical protein